VVPATVLSAVVTCSRRLEQPCNSNRMSPLWTIALGASYCNELVCHTSLLLTLTRETLTDCHIVCDTKASRQVSKSIKRDQPRCAASISSWLLHVIWSTLWVNKQPCSLFYDDSGKHRPILIFLSPLYFGIKRWNKVCRFLIPVWCFATKPAKHFAQHQPVTCTTQSVL